MVSAIIVCITLAACGGSSAPNNNTAKGSYPLTITGHFRRLDAHRDRHRDVN